MSADSRDFLVTFSGTIVAWGLPVAAMVGVATWQSLITGRRSPNFSTR